MLSKMLRIEIFYRIDFVGADEKDLCSHCLISFASKDCICPREVAVAIDGIVKILQHVSMLIKKCSHLMIKRMILILRDKIYFEEEKFHTAFKKKRRCTFECRQLSALNVHLEYIDRGDAMFTAKRIQFICVDRYRVLILHLRIRRQS